MTTKNYWDPTIRGRWLSVLLAIAAPCVDAATTLQTLTHSYKSGNTPANRAALQGYVASRRAAPDGPLAQLALGSGDLAHGRASDALSSLQAARPKLEQVADHVDFAIARALVGVGRKGEAVPYLERVIAARPVSAHRGTALVIAAEALYEAGEARRAVALIRPHVSALPAPKGWLVFGLNLEASGNLPAAVMELQKVYYQYPKSEEAARAETSLRRIKENLGSAYPPAMGQTMIGRAQKMMEAGDGRGAIEELAGMEPYLSGAEKDLARAKQGTARYFMRDYRGAIAYLRTLSVQSPEPDAERIYYWLNSARRINDGAEVGAAAREFERRQPKAPQRLDALIDLANAPLVANRVDDYEPLYRACHDTFRGNPKAAYCHFRVAWAHYLRRMPDAAALLREHVETYPESDDAASAVYFLGRIAEGNRDLPTARAHYEAIDRRYPNYYYATVSRQRLAAPELREVAAAPLDLRLPAPGPDPDFEMDTATRTRLDRAKLLESAGLEDWAEVELRFAARADAKKHLVSTELANMMTRAGRPDQGLRYVKSLAIGYLGWAFDRVPKDFWKAAFPMPFQESVDRYAGERSLDPHVVAGLIRQESEFDPKALSRAKAMGLTQIMPATGRELSRRLGIRTFQTAHLHQPDFNLKLGTFYMRMLLDSLDRDWVSTLAAYNAGKSRADMWKKWGEFREPTEFIETIPFHETRSYVQVVLRNADMYQRLYGDRKLAAPAPKPVAAAKQQAAIRPPPVAKKR